VYNDVNNYVTNYGKYSLEDKLNLINLDSINEYSKYLKNSIISIFRYIYI